MMASNVSDEAAAVASTVPPLITAGSTKLKSSVWVDFEYKAAGESGAAATATCRWCDKTLCAGGKNGTSHLHRHSKRCREERRRQPTTAPAAAGPSLRDQELEDPLYVVDGLNIPQLFDELDAKGLVHIDPPASDDAHFWPNLPQRASSSSTWFFQKTRERKRTARKRDAYYQTVASVTTSSLYNETSV